MKSFKKPLIAIVTLAVLAFVGSIVRNTVFGDS